jgi:hypothetical protein
MGEIIVYPNSQPMQRHAKGILLKTPGSFKGLAVADQTRLRFNGVKRIILD